MIYVLITKQRFIFSQLCIYEDKFQILQAWSLKTEICLKIKF